MDFCHLKRSGLSHYIMAYGIRGVIVAWKNSSPGVDTCSFGRADGKVSVERQLAETKASYCVILPKVLPCSISQQHSWLHVGENIEDLLQVKSPTGDAAVAGTSKTLTPMLWKMKTAPKQEDTEAGRGKYRPWLFVPQVPPQADLLSGFM